MPGKKIRKLKTKKSVEGEGVKNPPKMMKKRPPQHKKAPPAQVQNAPVPPAGNPAPVPPPAPKVAVAQTPQAVSPPASKTTPLQSSPVLKGKPVQPNILSSEAAPKVNPAVIPGKPSPMHPKTVTPPVNPAVPAASGIKVNTFPGPAPGIMKTQTDISPTIDEFPFEKQLELKTEELTDQVNNLLEIADSLLNPNWTADDIIDVIHVLVRSLNLDAVSLILPAINSQQIDVVLNRGYETAPNKSISDLWLNTFDPQAGIKWQNLMSLAENNQSDLAYWIVSEGLNSIGYVPIRDGNYIYGFLFVASIGKKSQSPLTASLLDLCGSHIGLAYALKFFQGQ